MAAKAEGLTDSTQLVNFLEQTLQQLEAAGGGVDEEARALLAQLSGAIAVKDASSAQQAASVANLSEADLAAHLGNIEAQLAAVEQALASTTTETRQFLSESATVWSGKDDPPSKDQSP